MREIEPGELIAIDEHGVRSTRFAAPTPKGCLFEYVYLARPDTSIAGQSVYTTRVQVGRTLAFEAPADADLVIPVPESGTPAAIGFAEQSGIPYGMGLVKNSYVGRTFIQPSQTIRQLGIRLKLNPLRSVVKGKRLVVVDDSIVRGNTQRALVRMLREAGAAEVHVRISSPPVMWPCFYGIDFASRAELIASGMGVEEIRSSIGADSLAFVSLEGLTAASGQRADRLCRACFDGAYPIEVPQPDLLGTARPRGAAARRGRRARVAGRARAHRGRRHRLPQRRRDRGPHGRAAAQRRGGAVVSTTSPGGSSYAAAGVDIEAGDRAVELLKSRVARTTRPEVVGGLGGFAGLFRLDTSRYRDPLLASSTDGVGTKLAIAQAMDKHDTVGIDLVGMVVDDLVVCGAEPLFMQDYVAVGRVVPERVAEIVGGIAAGCELAGCALVGGETAEHPGLMHDDHYDIAGTGVGVVEADELLGPHRVRPGDVVIAMASSGIHSNGFSLVRHVLLQGARLRLDAHVDELGGELGRGAARPRPGSTPRTACRWSRRPTCTPSRTSPAAAWPPTWRGSCPTASAPCSTAAPGRRRRSSAWCRSAAGSSRPRWSGRSTWASAWSRCSRPRTPTARWPCSPPATCPAWVLGEVAAGGDGAVTLRGAHPA